MIENNFYDVQKAILIWGTFFVVLPNDAIVDLRRRRRQKSLRIVIPHVNIQFSEFLPRRTREIDWRPTPDEVMAQWIEYENELVRPKISCCGLVLLFIRAYIARYIT